MGIFSWLNSEGVKRTVKNIVRPFYRLIKNKKANFVLKLLLILILAYTIYSQVFARDNIDELIKEFKDNFKDSNIIWLVIAILLMPINWILETIKWRVLLQRIEKVSFLKAFKGVFLGVTLSVFTPNRIGEYGGRILVVSPENNWKTIVATLVSSFSQQIALFTLGIIGLISFIYINLKIDSLLILGIGLIGFILIIFMLICYYNVRFAIPLFNRLPYLRRFTKHMAVLADYSFVELSEALFYAVLRYSVYTLQYFLILQFFGINVSILSGITGIATIFLLQTSIPLPAILDLFVRSEVAIYIWENFTDNRISILASSFGLWILNIIIPALFGMLFIFSVNITKSIGITDKDFN